MLHGSKEREQLFFDTFTPISHVIGIERLIKIVEELDYEKLANGTTDFSLTIDSYEKVSVKICPRPFYMLQIYPDGNIAPCDHLYNPNITCNVKTTGVIGAWQGSDFNSFRIKMLTNGAKHTTETCAKCGKYQNSIRDEEILDGHEEKILHKMKVV